MVRYSSKHEPQDWCRQDRLYTVTTTADIPQWKDEIVAYDRGPSIIANPHREFRTHCRCCGSLMPYTTNELNTCEHCGATMSTFDKE